MSQNNYFLLLPEEIIKKLDYQSVSNLNVSISYDVLTKIIKSETEYKEKISGE